VTIADGRVYIDGVPLDEPYLDQVTQGGGRSWVIPPLHVFVMGDNRSASRDSRIFGPVALEQLIGKAMVRYWPLEEVGVVP
jgi:signal peptidase I